MPTQDEIVSQLNQAERDWKLERHLTDDDLRAEMSRLLSSEKASIRRSIDEGEIYVVAGKDVRRIHYYNCSSLAPQVDRDRAWSRWLSSDMEDVRMNRSQGFSSPRMPELLRREHVEALGTYVTCQICSPTLSHVKKIRAPRSTKLRTLGQRHIGRELVLEDGESAGLLLRITTTVDAGGSHVKIDTTLGSLNESDVEHVYVQPAPASDVIPGE
jgi:hypothetical protein